MIFEDHEIRTLQELLVDYQRITSNYGHFSTVKSSYLKEILIKEFAEDIGFHERIQKNVSELVYDSRAAGTYLEAALELAMINWRKMLPHDSGNRSSKQVLFPGLHTYTS